MKRRRAVTAATPALQLPQEPSAAPVALSLADRRYRAQTRAWALMGTSIPTRDILKSYLDDIGAPQQ